MLELLRNWGLELRWGHYAIGVSKRTTPGEGGRRCSVVSRNAIRTYGWLVGVGLRLIAGVASRQDHLQAACKIEYQPPSQPNSQLTYFVTFRNHKNETESGYGGICLERLCPAPAPVFRIFIRCLFSEKNGDR